MDIATHKLMSVLVETQLYIHTVQHGALYIPMSYHAHSILSIQKCRPSLWDYHANIWSWVMLGHIPNQVSEFKIRSRLRDSYLPSTF
jgi:hypothetical protein